MRRHRKRNIVLSVKILAICIIISSWTMGVLYGGWTDEVSIQGSAEMGCWKPRLEIRKSLDGTYTDPETGEYITYPNRTNIAIAAGFESLFKMTIEVRNTGSIPITGITVVDIIENNVAPRLIEASQGTYSVYSWIKNDQTWTYPEFGFHRITWDVGTLEPGETEALGICIGTLANPSGKFEPTTGDEGDGQWVEMNRGAEMVGYCYLGELSASTTGIRIEIEDDGGPENGIGSIVTPLPFVTPWGVDFY